MLVAAVALVLVGPRLAEAGQPAPKAAPPAASKRGPAPDAAKLKAILTGAAGKPLTFAHVVDLDTGEVVLDINGQRKLTPASVSKMFTTAAAALSLDLNERLVTRVLSSKVSKGRAATVAIVGGGDMSLSRRDMARLADAVAKKGIRRIKTLVVDTTLFDRKLPRGFSEKNSDSSYRAPIDALNLDQGAIVISVKPGPKHGGPARVEITAPSAAILIDNGAKTVKGRRRGLTVKIADGGKGRTKVVVRGVLGAGVTRGVAVRRRVENAGLHAGHAFARMLKEREIRVGRVAFAPTSRGRYAKGLSQLAAHKSPSLYALMRYCNQHSHNGYAETFFKLIGARSFGAPGTCAKGERAVQKALARSDIDWKRVKLGNGSGLYHANEVTAVDVVRLLVAMHKRGKTGARWRRSLAIGGVKGTLRRRLHGAATYNKIFAKTGTLDDVTALAGYGFGDGRRYAYALFYNRVKKPAWVYRRVHDRFLTALLDPSGKHTPTKAKAKPKSKTKSRAKSKRPKRRSSKKPPRSKRGKRGRR